MSNDGKAFRLLLVDDHPVVREGLRTMLSTHKEFSIVGEASSGEEAVEMVTRLDPHVVLTDIRMPGMDGIELTRQIKAIRPSIAVIVLTIYESEMYLLEALRAGASGYLLKDSPQTLLCHAISTAIDGGTTIIRSDLLQQAVQTLHRAPNGSQGNRPNSIPTHQFTDRELNLLEMISQGYSNKEMAGKLNLAEVTIKKYIQGIFVKLGVSNRTHAAIIAVRMGLVEKTSDLPLQGA